MEKPPMESKRKGGERSTVEQRGIEPPPYKYIEKNMFSYRKHTKQKEEDIVICVCRYDANDMDSACGDRCLNALTSTECTPGYCPCNSFCKNQRFQKSEYARTRLFTTAGRGWGLLADEDIKAGQFVIEYCGEVISCKEAKQRFQAYEAEGLKDAFIISLNGYESIDATRKGSLARFINHSCHPNCETRKWNVLGEVRVGIFAKQDISAGTELAYDYNFEWYGGAKVRCLCGATCCSGFLGAKSRGFQEATYLWEDDDDRYSVENVPLYDSEDDEPTSKYLKALVISEDNTMAEREIEDFMRSSNSLATVMFSESKPISVQPLNSVPMETDDGKVGKQDKSVYPQVIRHKFAEKSSNFSRVRNKSSQHHPNGRSKNHASKPVNVRLIGERLSSKEACDELLAYEEAKNLASLQLNSLYDEIRPAIEEHERDSQDSVSTTVAEKWIEASCCKLKAEFDLSSALIMSISTCISQRTQDDAMTTKAEGMENGMKYLENGPS